MYKFDAAEYGGKIKKVNLARLVLRGIWLEDVADRAIAVGIWPNRSGWGLGWVDLLQKVTGAEDGAWFEYEPDEEGNPAIKRHYGLVEVVWKGVKEENNEPANEPRKGC